MQKGWLFSVIAGFCAIALTATADDWPQWRGPQRNGISQETGLLKVWPKEGPKLLWQVKDIGDGYSTPSVVGDRIYVLSNRGMDNEFVQALDVKDGQKIWETRLGNVGPNGQPQYPAARSTPTVVGDVLYAFSSDGDLACVETATGKIRWKKSVRDEFNGKPGTWAYSESPLVDGDLVVVTPGGKTATMVALNKDTGETVWKSAIPGGDSAGYASAIIVHAGGRKQYVQFLGKGVAGVDAKTGEFLWRYDKTGNSPANIQTPVAHESFVYTGGGGRSPISALVEIKANDDKLIAEQVYFERGLPTAIGGAVRVGDYLYGTNQQGLVCAEFTTGKGKWQDKCVGVGSLCYADGCLYVHGENGKVALVEATPDGYREKGMFNPPDQPNRGRSKAWAYPVVANGRLYIRDMGVMWCYDVSDPAAK